ncbi:MAG: DUF2142 domain-containing protein [Ardenticatenaceae bacterium]|nr:DUF2142 domain-containing protein [Ardenticatenaceae bacterium]
MKRTDGLILSCILLVYLFVGTLYAAYTPAWQAPDEPAHYNYVRQLAAGKLPVIENGDYDQKYIETIVGSRFDPQYSVAPLTYEDWQPPLYYLLQTPVYWLSGGSLLALRLFSMLLGAGVVALAYGVARRVFPEQRWVAATTAVFVAFLPQHLTMLASVNNDSLAELLIGGILWVLLGLLEIGDWRSEIGRKRLVTLGVLLGLGFLTKAMVYLLAPVAGLVVLWRCWGKWGELVQTAVLAFAPALLLGLLLWGRNIIVYDGLDIMASAAHNSVVVGQPRTAEWVAKYGVDGTLSRFATTTFNSFWGQFGWMAVPMPRWVYAPLTLFTLLVLIGLLIHWRHKPAPLPNPQSPISNLILFLTLALTLTLYLGYNLVFVQHQGRYLFPALIPIGIGVALGLGSWLRPFSNRWPILLTLLPLGLALALVGLDLFALFRFIIPNLT